MVICRSQVGPKELLMRVLVRASSFIWCKLVGGYKRRITVVGPAFKLCQTILKGKFIVFDQNPLSQCSHFPRVLLCFQVIVTLLTAPFTLSCVNNFTLNLFMTRKNCLAFNICYACISLMSLVSFLLYY